MKEMRDDMGILQTRILGLNVKKHAAVAEIGIEARQHRVPVAPQ